MEECVAVVSVKDFISDTRTPCLGKLEQVQVLKEDKKLIQTQRIPSASHLFKWTYDLKS